MLVRAFFCCPYREHYKNNIVWHTHHHSRWRTVISSGMTKRWPAWEYWFLPWQIWGLHAMLDTSSLSNCTFQTGIWCIPQEPLTSFPSKFTIYVYLFSRCFCSEKHPSEDRRAVSASNLVATGVKGFAEGPDGDIWTGGLLIMATNLILIATHHPLTTAWMTWHSL